MLKVLSSILCDLDPKVKVIGQKAGICDGVPSTSALVLFKLICHDYFQKKNNIMTFDPIWGLMVCVKTTLFRKRLKLVYCITCF